MYLDCVQLKLKKDAFINAAHLVSSMEKYRYYKDEKSMNELDVYAEFSNGLPLPSGRWGNAIALALEVNNYTAAEHLIDNAKELKLDTNTVVSELGFKNPWSLHDEYLFSQLTFDEYVHYYANDEVSKRNQEVAYENIEANRRLEKKLNITLEDKKLLNQK